MLLTTTNCWSADCRLDLTNSVAVRFHAKHLLFVSSNGPKTKEEHL